MAFTISIYNRKGTKLKVAVDIPGASLAGASFNYSSSTGKMNFIFTYDGTKTVKGSFIPDTPNISGVSKSPMTITPDYVTGPHGEKESFSLYESYEGAPAGAYTISYVSDGSPVPPTTGVSEVPLPIPRSHKETPEGDFVLEKGWYYDELRTQEALSGDTLYKDTTLYVLFGNDSATVTVYSADGGTVLGRTTTRYGYISAQFGEIPEGTATLSLTEGGTDITDYITFPLNLSQDEELLGLAYTQGAAVPDIPFNFSTVSTEFYIGDKYNLYLVVKIQQPTPTYTLTYDTAGGVLERGYSNPTTGLTEIPLNLPVVQRTGYFFAGWYRNRGLTFEVVPGSPLTRDTTIYAKMVANSASIDVILYQNKAETNRVNKKPYLVEVETITGTFRQSVNILQPVITIEYDQVPRFNYIYISTFGRYYFITSITNINKNVYELSCRCDTLYTYMTSIRGLYAYVARNENTYNNFVLDSVYPSQCGVTRTKGSLVSGSSWSSSDTMISGSVSDYKVMIQVNGTLRNASNNTIPTKWYCPTFVNTVTGARNFLDTARNYYSDIDKPALSHVLACKWLPYSIRHDDTAIYRWYTPALVPSSYITFGTGTYAAYTPQRIVEDHTWTIAVRGVKSADPFYLNFSPFTNIYMTFLPFGRFELDTQRIYGRTPVNGEYRIYIRTRTNSSTGQSALYWGTDPGDISTYLGSANVSIDIPILSSNYNIAKVVSGAATVVGSVATAIASGGASVPATMAGLGGALAVGEGLRSAESGIQGGGEGTIDAYPTVEVLRKGLAGSAYSLRGRPLYRYVPLRTLSGFTQVDSVHVEGLPSATEAEVSEIESLLKSGVIL